MIHLQLPTGERFNVTSNNGILIMEGKQKRCIRVKHEPKTGHETNWRIWRAEELEAARNSAYEYFKK